MSENVTVLTDELGLQREYTEVKRKAAVGERIKVTENIQRHMRDMTIGNLYEVIDVSTDEETNEYGEASVEVIDDAGDQATAFLSAFVVLEPTDIIRIDGERFRIVERKANVGERVKVVNAVANAKKEYGYDNGEVYEVVSLYGDEPHIRPDGTEYSEIFLHHEEYHVIESLKTAHQPQPQPPAEISAIQRSIDALTEMTAMLALKVTELERNDKRPLTEAIRDIAVGGAKKLTRDDVIERAKADVAELIAKVYVGDGFKSGIPTFEDCGPLTFKFVINRDKRTVVALGALKHFTEDIEARGIAKCAPDDVFNVYIGKAIALRRALGLEVPDEYVNAPKPTEVRVGGIVNFNGNTYGIIADGDRVILGKNAHIGSQIGRRGRIIDDSHDQTEVSVNE